MLRVITNSSYSNKTAFICITTWGVKIMRWHSSPVGQAGLLRVTTGLLITPRDLYLWGYQGLKFTLPFCHSAQKNVKWCNYSWPEHLWWGLDWNVYWWEMCCVTKGVHSQQLLPHVKETMCSMYKVVQTWPGQFVCKQAAISPGHIWTTLYVYVKTQIYLLVVY